MSSFRLLLSVIFAGTLTLGSLGLTPECASACSCARQPGKSEQAIAEEAFSRSQAVFTGEVIEVGEPRQQPGGGTSSADPVPVSFRVAQVWKGTETEPVEVTTPSSDASCGYPFREGASYLVYASEGLEVDLCSNTQPLFSAGVELETLGSGAVPVQKDQEQDMPASSEDTLPDSGGIPAGIVAVAGMGASVLFVGVGVLALLVKR